MAKDKPAKSSKPQSAPAKRSASALKLTKSAKMVNKPAADNSPAFTGIAIGHAAGEVWGFLSGGAPRTIAEIKKGVDSPGDVVMAALGWLAREEKLEFVTNGKTIKIGLR